jgi:hypothetical protein
LLNGGLLHTDTVARSEARSMDKTELPATHAGYVMIHTKNETSRDALGGLRSERQNSNAMRVTGRDQI